MKNYKLTIQDGVITWIENADENGNPTHIVFEGDPELEIGVIGTEFEAKGSDYDVYKSMPSDMYPKAERLVMSCSPKTNVSTYCKKYDIREA